MEDLYTFQQVQEVANEAANQAASKVEAGDSIGSIVGVVLQLIIWGAFFASQRKGNKENKEIATAQLAQTTDSSDEIKRQLADNTKKIVENSEMLEKIDETLEADTKVSVATARTALKSVYDRLSPNRRLTMTEKAMVTEMYNAYKSVTYPDGHHPNSWCDELINDINTWEVVPDGYTPARLKTASKSKAKSKAQKGRK